VTKLYLPLVLLFALRSVAFAQACSDASGSASTDASLTSKVDGLFSRWDKPDSPGCALAVIKDGTIIYQRGYGMSNLEYDVPIVPRSIFHVASISKQFTALAMAMLAQQGKLSLDDPVRKYVPELPDFGAPITIRHLIHHTSGLRDQWVLLRLAGWRDDDVITEKDILDLVSRQKDLNFKPGDEHLYCNTGYTLMAVIVKRVTGQSLREYCDATIFRPLGMSRTQFHDDHAMVVKNRTSAYRPRGDRRYEISIPVFDLAGATSLFTTVEDLARWDQNFYDYRVGGKAVMEQMLTPGKLNNGEPIDYAFGLVQGTYKGLKFYEHAGSDAGYRAHMIRFPDQRFSVAVLCNLSTMNPSELDRRVADIYLADQMKRADGNEQKSATTVQLSEEELAGKAGLYWSPVAEECRRLSLEDGQLVTNLGPDFPLSPLGKDRFQVVGTTVELTFMPPQKTGQPRSLVVTAGGKPVVYSAVQPVVPTANRLAEYAGSYYSEELDVTYTLIHRDGKLLVRRKKFADRRLQPTIADVFMSNQLGTIRFERDKEDDVSGFTLSVGRVRRLRFQKM
jgi:CubicO group peptidase (beta-lactamase class C family)